MLAVEVLRMAIPPDPIDEVLPEAAAVVVGEVTKILEEGKQAPLPKPERPGMTDVPGELRSQVIELRVDEVISGEGVTKGEAIAVVKPAGDYLLAPGHQGPFLLKDEGGKRVILGRYGPDSYRREVIEDALKRVGR